LAEGARPTRTPIALFHGVSASGLWPPASGLL
jgi:hypothetical protein